MAAMWPKFVPILSAADIHRGDLHGPDGTHCLLGWQIEIFGTLCTDVLYALMDVTSVGCIYAFNDDLGNSKSDVAAAWNRAMKSLGYTEVSPAKVGEF